MSRHDANLTHQRAATPGCERPEFRMFSKSECEAQNAANMERWRRYGPAFTSKIAAIAECTATEPCNKCYCSLCIGRLQHAIVPQAAAHFSSVDDPDCRFITVYLARFPEGRLSDCHPKPQSQRLRMMLARSGLEAATVLGSLEIGYIAADKEYLLHAHLAVSGVSSTARKKLRDKLKKSKVLRAKDDRKLRDPLRQISYALKFPLYHRPGRSGANKARAYPLPKAPLLELLQWFDRQSPEDLLFLLGLRWTGGVLKIAPKKPPATARI